MTGDGQRVSNRVRIASGAVIAALALGGCLHSEDKTKQKLVKGRKVFEHECSGCHVAKTTRNMQGPHLVDIVGRKAGTVSTYPNYSAALQRADFAWKPKRLKAYVRNPDGTLPGTTMAYPGLHDKQKLKNLVTYLKQPHAAPPKKKKKKSSGGGDGGGSGGESGGGGGGGH